MKTLLRTKISAPQSGAVLKTCSCLISPSGVGVATFHCFDNRPIDGSDPTSGFEKSLTIAHDRMVADSARIKPMPVESDPLFD